MVQLFPNVRDAWVEETGYVMTSASFHLPPVAPRLPPASPPSNQGNLYYMDTAKRSWFQLIVHCCLEITFQRENFDRLFVVAKVDKYNALIR